MKRLFLLGVFLCCSAPALADFTVCNTTSNETFVSIGYKNDGDWQSEGWWTVAPEDCAVIIPGALRNRYYYLRAVSEDATWTGKFSFCVDEEAFVIRGDGNCTERDYETAGFFEIDTENEPDWTQDLTD